MNVIREASGIVKRKWSGGRGTKALIITAAITAAGLAVVYFVLLFLGRLVKSLTSGGFRNMDLYFPRRRR